MSQSTELVRAEQGEQRRAAEVRAAESYRANAVAVQERRQVAEAAAAEADRQSRLPVIVDMPASTVTDTGTVVIARPQQQAATTVAPSPAQAVTPLSQANVDAWVADESRFDPQGVSDLKREWGADLGANLGYVRHFLHSHFTEAQRERAMDANILSVPVIRFLAEVAREAAHTAPSTSTTKGPASMAEQMTRQDAERKHAELTAKIHDAMARGDRLLMGSLVAERTLLSDALWPGTTEPQGEYRRTVG